jgi:hypothetical protein
MYITIDQIVLRDSVVGTATGYGLESEGVGVRVPVRARFFLLRVHIGPRPHATSYPMDTAESFHDGVKLTTHFQIVPTT